MIYDPDFTIMLFPIVVIEDRYNGTYSRGRWIAIACADKLENGAYRVVRVMEGGPHGSDPEAREFWDDPPEWVAVGNTPDEAVANLLKPVEHTYREPG